MRAASMRRRGMLGAVAAGGALVIAATAQGVQRPADSAGRKDGEARLLAAFRQMTPKQQSTALLYVEDIAAGWTDSTWRRVNHIPESSLASVADDFVALERARDGWLLVADVTPGGETPESEKAETALAENSILQTEIAARMATYRAKTPAGVRAKARMVAAYFGGDYPEYGCGIGSLLESMIRDAAGAQDGAV